MTDDQFVRLALRAPHHLTREEMHDIIVRWKGPLSYPKAAERLGMTEQGLRSHFDKRGYAPVVSQRLLMLAMIGYGITQQTTSDRFTNPFLLAALRGVIDFQTAYELWRGDRENTVCAEVLGVPVRSLWSVRKAGGGGMKIPHRTVLLAMLAIMPRKQWRLNP